MFEKLKVGAEYTRKSLDEVLELSKFEGTREGIVYLPDDTVLFVTLQKTGRAEDLHYNDWFEKDFFHWDSQKQQHIGTPKVKDIVNREVNIHLFARLQEKVKGKTQPFIYCGRLEYSDHDPSTSNPVHIVFESIDYQEYPDPHLAEIYAWKPGDTGTGTIRKSVGPKVSKRRSRGQGYPSDQSSRFSIVLTTGVLTCQQCSSAIR